MIKSKAVRRINKFIPIYNEYMGMFWFIKNKGLYEEFLNFYKDFSLEKIDDYKQKERIKKIDKKEIKMTISEIIEIWKLDDPNEKIKVIKEFLEEIKNSRGKLRKIKGYISIRFGEFEPILYPDQIITIKNYLKILEDIENE